MAAVRYESISLEISVGVGEGDASVCDRKLKRTKLQWFEGWRRHCKHCTYKTINLILHKIFSDDVIMQAVYFRWCDYAGCLFQRMWLWRLFISGDNDYGGCLFQGMWWWRLFVSGDNDHGGCLFQGMWWWRLFCYPLQHMTIKWLWLYVALKQQ